MICIFNKYPAEVASPVLTVWEPVSYEDKKINVLHHTLGSVSGASYQ